VKTIEEMLRALARSEVTEFAVVSDRLPCIKVGGTFEPIDDVAPSTDTILEMLVSTGGSRYVDALGPKASQWTTRVERIGTIGVTAMLRDDVVQARFAVIKRDPRAVSPLVPPPASPPVRPWTDEDGPALQSRSVGRGDSESRVRSAPLSPPPPSPAPPAAAAPANPEPLFEIERNAGSGSFRALRGSALDLVAASTPRIRAASSPPVFAPAAPALAFASPSPSPAILPTSASPSVSRGVAARDATFDKLLLQARNANASDLHVVPERPILLRIAGDLVPRGEIVDEAFVARIIDAIVPPRLRAELETEGSCDFAVNDRHGRCRINASRQRTGYKLCVRLIPAEIPTLASLGLPEQIAAATHHHQGLILITGPTGHGKTSTLAAIVDLINSQTNDHIITVEDPVEYVHPRKRALMSQREVGASTRSFQAALKGSLREDPDVIVVGELRDTETVRMALSASETGHLVLGTMNTPSAAKTIDRLIDLFPPADQAQVRMTLAGGLRLIVSQRLVPNGDRTGLIAAAELLPGSISLWSLIRDNKTFQIPSLQQRGKGIGIIRFDDSLLDAVNAGRTSLEIAKQYAENPEELELNALGTKPVMTSPPQTQRGAGEGGKDAVAGIFGKAGNLFRKGG
jgi:twitching motility protein PilT